MNNEKKLIVSILSFLKTLDKIITDNKGPDCYLLRKRAIDAMTELLSENMIRCVITAFKTVILEENNEKN